MHRAATRAWSSRTLRSIAPAAMNEAQTSSNFDDLTAVCGSDHQVGKQRIVRGLGAYARRRAPSWRNGPYVKRACTREARMQIAPHAAAAKREKGGARM
eukprot:6213022-Pleurochrysis_carterae.AAC.1